MLQGRPPGLQRAPHRSCCSWMWRARRSFSSSLLHVCADRAAQVIRKQLKQCYKEAGVNYQDNCRELAQVRARARALWARSC